MDASSTRATRRFTRRGLFRLAGAGALAGILAEGLRVYAFSNQHTVIPGLVYRSAQLSPAQLQHVIDERGIRTVLNLRGTCPDTGWYLGEVRTTHAANVSQEDISFSAKRLPAPSEVRRLLDVLDHCEKPVIFHCQRGADRTGLVATVSLLLFTKATLAEARRQLWPRYGHINGGRTTIIDEFFDFYETWLKANGQLHSPERFRDWALHHYCPGPYRAELTLLGPAKPVVPIGRGLSFTIRARNTSIAPWQFHPGGSGGIQLRGHLFTTSGQKLYTARAGLFEKTVPAGETIDLTIGFPPIREPGHYLIHADLLDTQPIDLLDSDFVQYGSEPLIVEVSVID
ncbi:MAG TPA: tyrosine-protein phosphatase [Urbifossiella sp.]|nr:tyrosine-protein phosphatase [Urbifossiella sp.]